MKCYKKPLFNMLKCLTSGILIENLKQKVKKVYFISLRLSKFIDFKCTDLQAAGILPLAFHSFNAAPLGTRLQG